MWLLCGSYRVYVGLTGVLSWSPRNSDEVATSQSISQTLHYVALMGRLYVVVWPRYYYLALEKCFGYLPKHPSALLFMESIFHETDWHVATVWQEQILCGCYGGYMGLTGVSPHSPRNHHEVHVVPSHSISQTLLHAALTGHLYMNVWPWQYYQALQ